MAKSSKALVLTEGNILSKIIVYAIPLMLTHLLQFFYSSADMMIVELSTEADAVGAIGTTLPFVNLILNICMGFATGTTVVVGKRIGTGDTDGISRAVHTSVLLSAIFGLCTGGLGIAIARPVLILMHTEGRLLDLAVTYICIYFAGLPFIAISTYIGAIIRAKGDSATPLWVTSLCGGLNLVLNLFFVVLCKMSVDGVAIATLISNMISTFIFLICLYRSKGPCAFRIKKLAIEGAAAKEIVRAGLPIGIQGSMMSLCNMYFQSSILLVNNLVTPDGAPFQPVIKGNSAVANMEEIAYAGTSSVFQSAIVFTSQNEGAGRYDRIKRIFGWCILVTTLITSCFSLAILVFNRPLLSLYGVHALTDGSVEAIAYSAAMKRIYLSAL